MAMSSPLRGARYGRHAHLGAAVAAEGHVRRLLGHVDQAVVGIWPAVVHPQDDRTVVLDVRHPHVARHRERQMRGGELCTIEDLAVGGLPCWWNCAPYQDAIPIWS